MVRNHEAVSEVQSAASGLTLGEANLFRVSSSVSEESKDLLDKLVILVFVVDKLFDCSVYGS